MSMALLIRMFKRISIFKLKKHEFIGDKVAAVIEEMRCYLVYYYGMENTKEKLNNFYRI